MLLCTVTWRLPWKLLLCSKLTDGLHIHPVHLRGLLMWVFLICLRRNSSIHAYNCIWRWNKCSLHVNMWAIRITSVHGVSSIVTAHQQKTLSLAAFDLHGFSDKINWDKIYLTPLCNIVYKEDYIHGYLTLHATTVAELYNRPIRLRVIHYRHIFLCSIYTRTIITQNVCIAYISSVHSLRRACVEINRCLELGLY